MYIIGHHICGKLDTHVPCVFDQSIIRSLTSTLFMFFVSLFRIDVRNELASLNNQFNNGFQLLIFRPARFGARSEKRRIGVRWISEVGIQLSSIERSGTLCEFESFGPESPLRHHSHCPVF